MQDRNSNLDQVLQSNKDCLAVYNSLVAIKQYIERKIMVETLQCGGWTREHVLMVSEGCQKVLALLRLSHYSLKGEYDLGLRNFRARLKEKLKKVEHLLPPGVSRETLVEWCGNYFRANF